MMATQQTQDRTQEGHDDKFADLMKGSCDKIERMVEEELKSSGMDDHRAIQIFLCSAARMAVKHGKAMEFAAMAHYMSEQVAAHAVMEELHNIMAKHGKE